MALARLRRIVVISADSRQIYRGLDIGTAKPTPEQLSLVPHYGIDIVDPGERYSAGQFAAAGAEWLASLKHGISAIVVGGTGFYVRALADGLFEEPPIDSWRREKLRRWATNAGRLGHWASRLDPCYSGGGRQRAARTVEVALLTGQPLSWWQARAKTHGAMRPFYVRLTLPRSVLHDRIESRTLNMLASGLVAEVDRMLASGVSSDARGLDAVGYREVVRHLEGDLEESNLAEAIIIATRKYAKRQETWFRHQLPARNVVTLDATTPSDALAERIAELWDEQAN